MDLALSIQEGITGTLPELLGVQFSEVTPERVVASLEVRPEVCTIGGILHGGAIMALADTLGAVGAFVNLPPNARTTTIESKTNFMGSAPVGSRVIGESTPLHLAMRTTVWQTQIKTEEGKLVALVIQTQLVLSN